MNDIVLALDGQVKEVTAIVSELRNHPAGTTDNGKLAGLANRLENSASSIATAVASLHQRGSQPVDEALADPVAGEDTGIAADDTLTQPVVDGSESAGNADSSTGEQSDDASGPDASSDITSGDEAGAQAETGEGSAEGLGSEQSQETEQVS